MAMVNSDKSIDKQSADPGDPEGYRYSFRGECGGGEHRKRWDRRQVLPEPFQSRRDGDDGGYNSGDQCDGDLYLQRGRRRRHEYRDGSGCPCGPTDPDGAIEPGLL